MLYYDLFESEDIVELILGYIDGISLLMIGSFNKTLNHSMKNRIIQICKNKPLPKYIIDRVSTNSDWRALIIGCQICHPRKTRCLCALMGIESGWRNISVHQVSLLNIDKHKIPGILPYGKAILLYRKNGIVGIKICGVIFHHTSEYYTV